MKYYYAAPSGYSMKGLIAAYEKGIQVEKIPVNLMEPQAKAEYQKTYSFGKVPMLELDNGQQIPESSIIVEYFDSQNNQNNLIPEDHQAARQARLIDRMGDLYLQNNIGTLFFNADNKEACEQSKTQINHMYEFLNKELEGKTWAAGEQFSMADCSLFPGLMYAAKFHPYEKYPNIQNYFNRLVERPSVQKVMEEAQPMIDQFFS